MEEEEEGQQASSSYRWPRNGKKVKMAMWRSSPASPMGQEVIITGQGVSIVRADGPIERSARGSSARESVLGFIVKQGPNRVPEARPESPPRVPQCAPEARPESPPRPVEDNPAQHPYGGRVKGPVEFPQLEFSASLAVCSRVFRRFARTRPHPESMKARPHQESMKKNVLRTSAPTRKGILLHSVATIASKEDNRRYQRTSCKIHATQTTFIFSDCG